MFNAQVVNPYDNGEEATITFEHDLSDSDWDIQFNPPSINLPGGPGGCPEHLEILLTPLVAEAGSVVVNVTYIGEQTGGLPEPVHFLTVKAINSDALDVEDPPRAVNIPPKVYPNPFRASTTVRFTLSSPAPVDIRVFDVAGRVVRTIQTGELPRGSHEIQWDGRDERGIEVPAGLFFIRLQVGDRKHALRVLKVG